MVDNFSLNSDLTKIECVMHTLFCQEIDLIEE